MLQIPRRPRAQKLFRVPPPAQSIMGRPFLFPLASGRGCIAMVLEGELGGGAKWKKGSCKKSFGEGGGGICASEGKKPLSQKGVSREDK